MGPCVPYDTLEDLQGKYYQIRIMPTDTITICYISIVCVLYHSEEQRAQISISDSASFVNLMHPLTFVFCLTKYVCYIDICHRHGATQTENITQNTSSILALVR